MPQNNATKDTLTLIRDHCHAITAYSVRTSENDVTLTEKQCDELFKIAQSLKRLNRRIKKFSEV